MAEGFSLYKNDRTIIPRVARSHRRSSIGSNSTTNRNRPTLAFIFCRIAIPIRN